MSKLIVKVAVFGASMAASFVAYNAYNSYVLAKTPSKFEKAATLLKFDGIKTENTTFSTTDQQDALLKIFYYAGYFWPSNLWQDINHLGFTNPKEVFLSVMEAVVKSDANQDDPTKFNPRLLRKYLFDIDTISESDAIDFLLYIGQHAFNRKLHQERTELDHQNWMELYKDDYLSQAAKLGLVKRISPTQDSYDEAVILGAARFTVEARVVDYMYNLSRGIEIKEQTFALAGQRPLWAEIDGISPAVHAKLLDAVSSGKRLEDLSLPDGSKSEKIKEGKNYMAILAKKQEIELNQHNIFVVYKESDDLPEGFRPHRTYLNYLNPKNGVLTETLMVYDVLKELTNSSKISIIDTALSVDGMRPDTSSTAVDYVNGLIQRVKDGMYGQQTEFIIYLQSNQPYVERQSLIVQEEVDRIVRESDIENLKVKVEGVGFESRNPDVKRIHSELGALINIKYQLATQKKQTVDSTHRALKDLQFSTRDHSIIDAPFPDFLSIENLSCLGRIQEFFSEIFE